MKGCWGAEEACTETVLCTETVAISQEVAFSVLKRNKIKSKKKIVLECHHSPTEEATPTMLGSITLSLPPLIEARAGLKTVSAIISRNRLLFNSLNAVDLFILQFWTR